VVQYRQPSPSWDQWRENFLATFKIKRNLFDVMREMMDCEPDQFETLYEYCFQKVALINRLKIPMNGEDQVSLITGAIQDEHLKFPIEASGITDPNVLAMHFKTLDKKNRFTKVAGPNLFSMRPARP
jgi:hypothetical protein